ncbi:MAG: cell division protein FtsX [Alphaproteobacteria bacterium]
MIRRRSALPLATDQASRFLPWLTALMVYLAALALIGVISLRDAAHRWGGQFEGTLTVQIVPAEGMKLQVIDEQVKKAAAILETTPGVVSVKPLDADATAVLLEPWLGRGPLVRELPLPRLIDVRTASGVKLDVALLAKQLAEVAPGALVDDHGDWLRSLTALARAIETVSLGVLLFIAMVAVAAMVFATRTGLALHHDVVSVLHMVGARDGFIARQFERHALWLSFKGGVLGVVLAGATLIGLDRIGAELAPSLLPRLELGWPQWLALLAVPVAGMAIATVTARVTVMRTLAKAL